MLEKRVTRSGKNHFKILGNKLGQMVNKRGFKATKRIKRDVTWDRAMGEDDLKKHLKQKGQIDLRRFRTSKDDRNVISGPIRLSNATSLFGSYNTMSLASPGDPTKRINAQYYVLKDMTLEWHRKLMRLRVIFSVGLGDSDGHLV